MQIDLETLVTVGVPTVGAIVWLVRLEGRINTNDKLHEAMSAQLERIEDKLDRLVGHK